MTFNSTACSNLSSARSPLGIDELHSDVEQFANYSGVESDPDALAIIDGYIAKGWMAEFQSLGALAAYTGGTPVFNKFACVTKSRQDGTL